MGRLIPKKKATIVEKSDNILIDSSEIENSSASTIQELIEEIDSKITLLKQASQ